MTKLGFFLGIFILSQCFVFLVLADDAAATTTAAPTLFVVPANDKAATFVTLIDKDITIKCPEKTTPITGYRLLFLEGTVKTVPLNVGQAEVTGTTADACDKGAATMAMADTLGYKSQSTAETDKKPFIITFNTDGNSATVKIGTSTSNDNKIWGTFICGSYKVANFAAATTKLNFLTSGFVIINNALKNGWYLMSLIIGMASLLFFI